MSVIIHPRGEAGGGVAAHLQCPLCGHFSKSHAHQLSHVAASHPINLDHVSVGRLGNIVMYQSTARLFHCSECFFTSRDFTKLYKHIISTHCEDDGEDKTEGKTGEGLEEEEKETEKEMEKETEKETEKEEEKEAIKRKRSSEGEEDEDGEGAEEGPAPQMSGSEKAEPEGDESVLVFDGAGYRCLICNWRSSKKGPGINHVVRKHDIPRAYANQSLRQHLDAALKPSQGGGGAEDEEGAAGLTAEMVKEEMEVISKVVRFISSRFVCLICGWKTKLKGFAISHVERSHNVERPYRCKICQQAFFLPSRMQTHVNTAHRPGRYACPFCSFRSEYLGGFRRHCSRCNAREEGEEEGGGEGEEEGGEEEEVEEVKERRKRRRVVKVMKEEEDEDEEEDD